MFFIASSTQAMKLFCIPPTQEWGLTKCQFFEIPIKNLLNFTMVKYGKNLIRIWVKFGKNLVLGISEL